MKHLQGHIRARDWIRTSTSFRTLPPQSSASTNFATRAEIVIKVIWVILVNLDCPTKNDLFDLYDLFDILDFWDCKFRSLLLQYNSERCSFSGF